MLLQASKYGFDEETELVNTNTGSLESIVIAI
jgi:hypothetical protein